MAAVPTDAGLSRHPMNRILTALLMLGGAPSFAPAQDTALTRLLLENRRVLLIDNGRLAGPGGRMLVEEGLGSRFFLVGEEHGVAEIPEVVQALLSDLRPGGYNTLAIEVSPLQGRRLDSMARRPGVVAALDTLLSSWFSSIPFYTLASERKLLASAMSAQGSTPPMRIWGLDYEVSGDRYYLQELERLASPAAQPAVRRARQLADSGFALFRTGNPSRLFAWSAPDSVFQDLRKALGSEAPARAVEILDVLERTARINRLFLTGRGYESNLDRSAWLRQNFIRALGVAEREEPAPRVLLKFGGSHVMRGWNYTHTLDVGTAAAVLAEAHGERSYHVLMVGGPGTKNTRMNITKAQYEPIGTAEIDGTSLAWLRPALPETGWVVFDLRAVRPAYLTRRSQTLTPVQDRFLHAYDAVVVLTGSTPGSANPLQVR
jgi:hypothetical protein